MDIVTGLAVDRPDPNGPYRITAELINTDIGSQSEGINVNYIELQGDSMFTAVRDGKRRSSNSLYAGALETVIISNQIAKDEGVLSILEQLFSSPEPRETIEVVVSQEKSAREHFYVEGIDTSIPSYEMSETIAEDKRTVDVTISVPIYKAYSMAKDEGCTLTLPTVHTAYNLDKLVNETNGLAYFKGDRLAGYLDAEETKYFLLITGEMKSGPISLYLLEDNPHPVSMNIKKIHSKRELSFEDGQLVFDYKMSCNINIAEIQDAIDLESLEQRNWLEDEIGGAIEKGIRASFENMKETGVDLFSLGQILYRKDHKLWYSCKDSWEDILQHASIRSDISVTIESIGTIKNY